MKNANEYMRSRYATNKEYAAYQRRKAAEFQKRQQRQREVVLSHYGNRCECCGESEPLFLTIDHKNNDGALRRKAEGTSSRQYGRIIAAGFPADLRLLCWNCNCGRARNNGVCPHSTTAGSG